MATFEGTLNASRRSFTKLALGAAALGASGEAKAQNMSGQGVSVPYNCYATSSFLAGGLPRIDYTCNPPSDLSQITLLLNLEYLEASYYLYATTGNGLPVGDLGGQAYSVIGGSKVSFVSPVVAAFAQQLAGDEQKHVEFLRNTIIAAGRVPASIPSIDFTTGFTAIMQLAGLIPFGQTYNAFASDMNFLLGAYVLEDALVAAYRGTLTSLVNPAYLDKLAGITATEGYHAGIVRALLFDAGASDTTNAISVARNVFDRNYGTPFQGNDHGVGTLAAPTITDGDGNSIIEGLTNLQAINVFTNTIALSSPTAELPAYFFTAGLSGPT
jgi:hypothetical protein